MFGKLFGKSKKRTQDLKEIEKNLDECLDLMKKCTEMFEFKMPEPVKVEKKEVK